MDLVIVFDASASIEEVFRRFGSGVHLLILQVFEHQRELTLSLLESLNFDGTLAVGFISFTSQPRLHIPLSTSNSKEQLVNAVNGIRIHL